MKRHPDRQSEMATDLHGERLERVVQALLESQAESVLDLGCGPGDLLLRLADERQFKKIVGLDTSREALAEARHLLSRKENAGNVSLFHGSFTSFGEDMAGFDAAVLVETIEHVEPHRLSAVEKAVFAGCRPKTVIITTPNYEYNVLHGVPEGAFRHPDHRFEWTRAKFRSWAEGVAGRNGYRARFEDIGERDPVLGSSTQMVTFSRI
jgi:3' terminal RNA ribose 2'-O-methyltransferase Hen1